MNITKPCSYHYLFSHISSYELEDALEVAEEVAAPLVDAHQLHQTEPLETPHPLVTPFSYRANHDTETYLLQFLVHDVLVTVLVLNQTDSQRAPMSYWKETLAPNFPVREDTFGQTTVLFAQANPDAGIVKEIANTCFGRDIEEPLPSCQFEWGLLYFLPQRTPHPGEYVAHSYVLLVPEAEHLEKGDQFLSFSFPMLESIRQKLVYEEQQAHLFKAEWEKHGNQVRRLLDEISSELSREFPALEQIQEQLLEVDDWQVGLHQYITETKNLLQTVNINTRNFELYLAALPIKDDSLFKSLPEMFRVIYEQISANVGYAENEAIILKHQWDNLRHKFNVQNQKAEQRKSAPTPVRMWEYELENLRHYYNQMQKKVRQLETPDKLRKAMNQVIEELDTLFQTHVARWILVSARSTVEAIVNEMYPGQLYQNRRWISLNEMIKKCHEENIFPEYIYLSIDHVRELGNIGAHGAKFAKRQTKEILSSLATVMEWYVQEKGF